MFDLGWVRVANPSVQIATGSLVAVEAHTLGLWSLNVNRITDTIRTENLFGFVYATTELHVEEGEERFLLEFDTEHGEVWYDIEAISRPRNFLARLGFPITRHFQRQFSRESHATMLKEVRRITQQSAN